MGTDIHLQMAVTSPGFISKNCPEANPLGRTTGPNRTRLRRETSNPIRPINSRTSRLRPSISTT